jgi:hypothetical protein
MSAKTVERTIQGAKRLKNSTHLTRMFSSLVFATAFGSYAQAKDLSGFGNDIPLSFAIQQILPPGYHASFESGVNQDMNVSWSGGAPWQTVLSNMLAQNHLNASFSGQTLDVAADQRTGGPAPVVSTPGLSISTGSSAPISYDSSKPVLTGAPSIVASAPAYTAPAHNEDAAYVPPDSMPVPVVNYAGTASVVTRHAAALPVVNPPSINGEISTAPRSYMDSQMSETSDGVWQVKAGQDLNDVLATWAHQAGWTLAYNTDVIYPLQANAQINGDFIGAVTDLINAVHADPRPYATFYKANHALVISDANHISESQGQ